MPTRRYPDGGFAAHLFGYVSEIQEAQLERDEYSGLQQGAIVGQAGLEKTYNTNLMGKDGARSACLDTENKDVKCESEGDADGADKNDM